MPHRDRRTQVTRGMQNSQTIPTIQTGMMEILCSLFQGTISFPHTKWADFPNWPGGIHNLRTLEGTEANTWGNFGRGGSEGSSQPEIIETYSQLCTQGSLLVVFKGPYEVLESKPR